MGAAFTITQIRCTLVKIKFVIFHLENALHPLLSEGKILWSSIRGFYVLVDQATIIIVAVAAVWQCIQGILICLCEIR
jgi:hypothetical protein